MIIKSITIENFRSFYGEQTIDFATDKQRNTTVIYGMNGVGKTNLLNSILWCLYGEFSPGFKNHDDILNWEAKKRGRKSYHVSVCFEENSREYIVKRSGGDLDHFKVFENIDGNIEQIRQEPRLFINSIIPRDMSGYFISDGEGSDLTVDVEGMISVRRSIRDVLGFNVAERTIEDLARVRSEIRNELKKFDKDKELADIEERIQVFDESILKNRSDLESNKSALEEYQIKREQIDRKLGGSSSAVVQQLQSERSRAENELQKSISDLRAEEFKKIKLIREFSWVAFSNRLLGEGLDFIDDSEIKGKIPAPYNIQLVKDILSQSECICGTCISVGTDAYRKIESLLDKAADPGLINRVQRARSRLTAIQTLSNQAKDRLDENYRACKTLDDRVNSLRGKIQEYSDQIDDMDDEEINQLERSRKVVDSKLLETSRSIGRIESKLKEIEATRNELYEKAKRIEGLTPRAKFLKHRLEVVNSIESMILKELDEAESSISSVLEEKINSFLDKYLRQDYQAKMTSDFKIGLVDRNGLLVPPSGGQGAILSFIYISSLISIARERRDLESAILTPGAVAPLVFDAPFSKLDPKYAPNVARELPNLVDQLIILMYQDPGKNVDVTLKQEGRLGFVYIMTEETAASQDDKPLQEIEVEGDKFPVTVYGAPLDKVVIKKVKAYE